MAITVPQIPGALQAVADLQTILNDTRMLLQQAKELSDKGWTVDIGSRATITVTVSPEQRAAMIAQYDTYKNQLIAVFQTLP